MKILGNDWEVKAGRNCSLDWVNEIVRGDCCSEIYYVFSEKTFLVLRPIWKNCVDRPLAYCLKEGRKRLTFGKDVIFSFSGPPFMQITVY